MPHGVTDDDGCPAVLLLDQDESPATCWVLAGARYVRDLQLHAGEGRPKMRRSGKSRDGAAARLSALAPSKRPPYARWRFSGSTRVALAGAGRATGGVRMTNGKRASAISPPVSDSAA